MVNDELETVNDYLLSDSVSHCLQLSDQINLKGDTMLIDSCSTINLITNKDIIHDIHQVTRPLKVQCNVGVWTTNLMGMLRDFPELVWHDPQAVANILSLHTVKKYYWVIYDSQDDDTFVVIDRHGNKYCFAPTGGGLYAYRQDPDQGGSLSTQWSRIKLSTRNGHTTMQFKLNKYRISSYAPVQAIIIT